MTNIPKLIEYTRQMRHHQREYFRLAGMARKNPQYWNEARHMLSKSKRYEIDVDNMLAAIPREEVQNG